MQRTPAFRLAMTFAGWLIALLMFFPIAWMLLTAFKSEIDAVSVPPQLLFDATLENFAAVNSRSNYLGAVMNSVAIALGSTLLGLAIAIPAAYAMAFRPGPRTEFILMWILSTKMMPAVGVLVPIYLLYRGAGLLDSVTGLVLITMLANLPIIVWMLYSFFKEVPHEILEAARMDGAGPLAQIRIVLLPLTGPGIASTSLLAIILAWNESFWSINLSSVKAAPLTAFIASFSSPEGLFWAKLSAASTLAVVPILIFGWLTQRQLVRGLTFGAVK
jgi:sorbitol/mannitol transport system permease protein